MIFLGMNVLDDTATLCMRKNKEKKMSEMRSEQISFDIQGEFVTKIAREWFYTGEKSLDKVMELLLACMENPAISEDERKRHAEDILLGRAALKGSSAAGTYHLERYEPGEEEPMPKNMNIWKEAEKKLSKMDERWDIAMEYVPEGIKREIRKALGEETAEDRQQEALSSYVKRMTDPSMGIAFATRDDTKRYTKPQKEFLYNFYIERDCHDEANAIWREDE